MRSQLNSSVDLNDFESSETPPLPNYLGAGICNIVPATFLHLTRSRGSLFSKSLDEIESSVYSVNDPVRPDLDSWFPAELSQASQIVILVLDGLGYNQFLRVSGDMTTLSRLNLKSISSVAPTTTATALTSITTGASPLTHGILGYRMRLTNGKIMNSLSWACQTDLKQLMPEPEDIQKTPPFLNFHPKVVTKAQYQNTGFTKAHLRDTQIFDYRFPSTMVDHVSELLHKDEAFIYSYYEGIDTVAHEYGLGDCYVEELKAVDYFIGRMISLLPKGAGLLITADHGQVEVPESPIEIDRKILDLVVMLSGEGRFRWLHLKNGRQKEVVALAKDLYGNDAWVMTRDELIEGGFYGSPSSRGATESRLGDVALIAKSNVAFYDPVDTGPYNLISRHGSLTHEELDVPLFSYLA